MASLPMFLIILMKCVKQVKKRINWALNIICKLVINLFIFVQTVPSKTDINSENSIFP